MTRIYVPSDYLNKSCYQVNQDYIRVWDSVDLNESNDYYDILLNQDYQVKKGSELITTTIQCDSINTYTDDLYYRVDFDKILVIFIILLVVLIYFPFRIFSRVFGRWLKL